jgi:hypothetical protein
MTELTFLLRRSALVRWLAQAVYNLLAKRDILRSNLVISARDPFHFFIPSTPARE